VTEDREWLVEGFFLLARKIGLGLIEKDENLAVDRGEGVRIVLACPGRTIGCGNLGCTYRCCPKGYYREKNYHQF